MRVGGVAVLQSSSVSSEILCVLDDAGCLVAPEVTDWVSFLEACHVASALCEQVATAVVVFLWRVNLSNLVLVVCDVITDVVLEVLSNLVLPVERNLDTGVLNSTGILQLRRETCCR